MRQQNIPQLPQGVNYLPTTPPNCSLSPDYPKDVNSDIFGGIGLGSREIFAEKFYYYP